jgi:hypothetical protein
MRPVALWVVGAVRTVLMGAFSSVYALALDS